MSDGDLDTTLVRRGNSATTFTDMTEFVAEIEQRPLDKLLGDLPGLARLSELKFSLARQILQRRIAKLPPVERDQLRVFADELLLDADDAERVMSVFAVRTSE